MIGGLFAAPGSKASGLVDVEGTGIHIPITLICGKGPGKTVLISGGIHNAEYVGIQSAIELAREMRPEEVRGNVVVIHVANPSGFENRTMSQVFEDGKNLNRLFPGNKNGTPGDRLAYTIASKFHRNADNYIDLHGGDGFEDLAPYVYFVGKTDERTAGASKAMAEVVDVLYMVRSAYGTEGSFNHAGSCGIPSILIERGCSGRWVREEVEMMKKDVRNVLRHLEVLSGPLEDRGHHPSEVRSVEQWGTGTGGCWYPNKRAGETFAKGEVLGEVKDYFGTALDTCVASADGVILYQACSLCVPRGSLVVTYGCL